MPVVIPAGASSSSSAQSLSGQSIYDYILDDTGAPVPNAKVTAILNGDFITSIAPQVLVQPTQVSTTTDGNGFWQLTLVPNTNLSPANTTYTIQTPFRSYDIQVGPSGPYQSTSLGTLVNIPTTLGPATSSISGPLTVSGAFSATAGATISGGLTVTGALSLPGAALSLAGPLTLTAATSQIIPGATSLSLRNSANSADNLLVTDAGLVTARAGLVATAGGITATAGDLAITAGKITMGAAASQLVPGATSFSVRDNANANDNLLVSNAGAVAVRNGLTVTAGGVTVTAGGITINSGNLTMSGNLVLTAAASQIVPGATSLALRNNANNASNLSVPDNGQAVFRNGLALLGGTKDVGAGTIAYAPVTANQGTFTAQTDLTSLTTGAQTLVAGRRYLLTAKAAFTSSVATDVVQFLLIDTSGPTTLDQYLQTMAASGAVNMFLSAIVVPGAGSKTYKLAAARNSGTGNITMNASATQVAYIMLQDIGT